MSDFPPQYVDASNASRIVGVVGFFHFLALTFVSLRIYARLVIIRAFGVDDALIIASVVSVVLVSRLSVSEKLLMKGDRSCLRLVHGSAWSSRYPTASGVTG